MKKPESKKCPNCGACSECGAPHPHVIPMPYPVPYAPFRPPYSPGVFPGTGTNPQPYRPNWISQPTTWGVGAATGVRGTYAQTWNNAGGIYQ